MWFGAFVLFPRRTLKIVFVNLRPFAGRVTRLTLLVPTAYVANPIQIVYSTAFVNFCFKWFLKSSEYLKSN